jgi:succinate dehydrogenase/fumarate reductase cytochrome b subunit
MEVSQTQKKSNPLLQFGLISALGATLYFVILYILGAEAMMSPAAFLNWLIPIVCCVLACRKAKADNDGYLEFKNALKICFGILVLTGLFTSVFNYVLMNFADPALAERIAQLSIEKGQEMMERFGVPQDKIDEEIKKMTAKNLYSLKSTIQGLAVFCIFYFIIALIIAAIMKKNKPEFAD